MTSNQQHRPAVTGGRMPSLYPTVSSSGMCLPRPTLTTASTIASAKAAPVLKPRQVTPESAEGAAGGGTAAPFAPALSRTTTGSSTLKVEYPTLIRRTTPSAGSATAGLHVHIAGSEGYPAGTEEGGTQEECGKKEVFEEEREKGLGLVRASEADGVKKQEPQVGKMPISPTEYHTNNTSGISIAQNNPTTSRSCSTNGTISSNKLRGFHGTLCLNTADLTDRDESEDEALAVFRDSIALPPPQQQEEQEQPLLHQKQPAVQPPHHPAAPAANGHAPSSVQAQPRQQQAPRSGASAANAGPATASSVPPAGTTSSAAAPPAALSVANLAQRALEAHVRAEAAIIQLVTAEQCSGMVSAPVAGVSTVAGGGIYPTIPAREAAVAGAARATEMNDSSGTDGVLELLLERQRIREQLLAADAAAASYSSLQSVQGPVPGALAMQMDPRYSQFLASSASPGSCLPPNAAAAASSLSNHMMHQHIQQHTLHGMKFGAHYGVGLGGAPSAPGTAAYMGDSAELRRMVEKEENELRQLQMELQQQQQQLQRHQKNLIGPTPSQQDQSKAETSFIADVRNRRIGPLKKRLKQSQYVDLGTSSGPGPASEESTGGNNAGDTNSPGTLSAIPDQRTSVPTIPSPGKRILLYSPEDHHWLSDQLCFVRKLIEIFEANEEDVTARSRRGGMKRPIQIGRVGLRCVYCSNVPARQRAKGAVSYPNSIRIVHQAIRNFQRYHLMQCPNMPQETKDEYESLKTTRCHSGNASLQYWVTSCHALGMCDTDPDNGIRLRPPPPRETLELQFLAPEPTPGMDSSTSGFHEVGGLERQKSPASVGCGNPMEARALPAAKSTRLEVRGSEGNPRNCSESEATTHPISGTTEVDGMQSNQGMMAGNLQTTPYMSLILSQQRPTFYQPADSLGKRRPRPSGFPGMECKHCSSPSRVASPGRYFPLTTTVLANNNNPGGCVYVHLMKCGRCPQEIKVNLQELAERHAKDGDLLERGWRRRLFTALWDRLHEGRTWTEDLLQGEVGKQASEEDDSGDDVGTAALALSALSGLAESAGTKRKQPSEE